MVIGGLQIKPAFYRLILLFRNDQLSVNDVSRETGLLASSVKKYLTILEKQGLVERKGSNIYVLTSRGKMFRDFLEKIKPEYRAGAPYIFTDPSTGTPIPLEVRNYAQLYAVLKYELIEKSIAEEHLRRGYLLEWIKNGLKDQHLAEKLERGELKSIEDLIKYLEFHMKIVKT